MTKIELVGLTVTDLQNLLDNAVSKAIEKYKEEQKAPSDWEELTLDQAAKEAKCCKATIRRKMKEHKIPLLKFGKEILIKRADLKKIKKQLTTN